ncbi:hypothetical protein BDN72DRAFT_774278, partial [Pluteus cervinus]
VGHLFGILATVVRLYRRFCLQRMWWDDCAVALSLASSLCYFSIVFMSKEPSDPSLTTGHPLLFWLTIVSFTNEVWSARVSLSISIVRLFPKDTLPHKIMEGVSVFLAIAWLSFIGGKVGLCVGDSSGDGSGSCALNDVVAISNVVAGVTADGFLMFTPIPLVWCSELPRGLRILLVCAFASSILSMSASVAYAVLVFRRNELGSSAISQISLAANVQVCANIS